MYSKEYAEEILKAKYPDAIIEVSDEGDSFVCIPKRYKEINGQQMLVPGYQIQLVNKTTGEITTRSPFTPFFSFKES